MIDIRLESPGLLHLADRQGGSLLLDVQRVVMISWSPSEVSGTTPLIATVMYEYRLLDRQERELLVYHWQPGPRYAGPNHPHLHISASLRAMTSAMDEREIDLDKLHLPTGQIALAAIVRSLVTEFAVEPLRPDWARTLDGAEAAELAASGRTS